MKRIICLMLVLALSLAGMLPSVSAEQKNIKVIATIFPIYDWAREVIGDNEHVELSLLLDSGVDLHSYQPTAADIMKIATCDVFVYVGGESDEWVEDALKEAVNKDMVVVSLVEAMGDEIKMEEIVEGMEHEHDHDHEGEEDHDHEAEEDHDHEGEEDHDHDAEEDHDHEGEEDHDHEHEHGEEADEHVWLSLRNAEKLVHAVAEALAKADPGHADSYHANAAAYAQKLSALDAEYAAMTKEAAVHTVLFGDRFPFRYLTDDYDLDYYAAFSGCSAETEASFQTIVFLAQKTDELQLPAVLTIEGANHKIAETVIGATAAKNQKLLTMNSMQGCTMQDIQSGVTYLSIMQENLEVLKQALN